jgi:hypothetical protein
MGEGGPNASSVSEVAKRLAEQDFQGGASETARDIIERVTTEAINDRRKVANTFLRQSKLAKSGKLGRGRQQKQTEAGKGGDHGPEEAPAKNHPAADAVVAENVDEHVGEADGKAKRKRGKRKRGRDGQGAKSGPDQQQAAPVAVQGRPSGAPRGNRQTQCPRNDNRPDLSLPREQRRAEVDNRRAAPTEPGLHAGTNPLYEPPGAVRLGGTPDGLLNVLWTTIGDVSVRHPPLIVALALTTLSFWALSPPPLNSSRSGFYISDKGIRIPQSWSNCL